MVAGANAVTEGAGFTVEEEMAAYDRLPPHVRECLRDAPFNVSAKDYSMNGAIQREMRNRSIEEAKVWLKEQLLLAYRRKFTL